MEPVQIALIVLQSAFIVAISPLITGVIRKLKALMQSRKGASVFQPYFDLYKLFRKESVVSSNASWVFHLTPYVCMAAVLVAVLMVPVISTTSLSFMGDLIVVVYMLTMMRFFMALSALDTGSAFGGMGSSREMTISAIAEPTMLLAIFTMALIAGTTSLGDISYQLSVNGLELIRPSLFLGFAALFIVTLAENARVPVDNPATHLELTMIHEGMILEYSGKQLALMELSSMVKLALFLTILANVFLPWGIATSLAPAGLAIGLVALLVKILIMAGAIAYIESCMAKLRLFRLPNLLTVSFTLALLAVMSYYIL
ncbi:respiratory chain complex I subunit 1 family protein [Methanocella arvoryzae]|uniref:Hydrogenase, membrane subunit 3-like protein (EchB-like) n=1 Tax=Methanocella arvoryzae (strain DSM 22066 / NBRC 105507 / MRE50) TaxID=351160 RepID=Q0W2B6_METAR|nr:NADH-quinone oxidoreductase subunit H [Methanocella arvoryzae]CAJ37477.1 hydrogenase, membrane subunit 3-like protein (EchB-like) [Methanocella arvoryzae MRE50]